MLESLLKSIMEDSSKLREEKLQVIVCVMAKKDAVYKLLKWVSETRIGVVFQCCLSSHANEGKDQYLVYLCLKINAKLGGINFELIGNFPHFGAEDHVMFIGACVNHRGHKNDSCQSIAVVVGTVNWPAANRYAGRVWPQANRSRNIQNFGATCSELVQTYVQINKVRPKGIVVFRDRVDEGQFEMIRNEKLLDLKKFIYDGDYQPKNTVNVTNKRHKTRLFVENGNDASANRNVPPGTVLDSTVVGRHDIGFYLCSHDGSIGTSRPTHDYVLWDENSFTSDHLHKLIYHMCFAFARCTGPVSFVPPAYYANLVAYRGRMYQEVEEGLIDSSSRASTSKAPSSTASFDRSFYVLHPDLENVMFFV